MEYLYYEQILWSSGGSQKATLTVFVCQHEKLKSRSVFTRIVAGPRIITLPKDGAYNFFVPVGKNINGKFFLSTIS